MKRSDGLIHAVSWINLPNMVLRGRRQTQNITCCRGSFVWNTPKRQTCKGGTETSGYLGLGRKLRLNGREESKGGWWKFSRTGLWRWSCNSVNFLEVMAPYNLRRRYLWCRNIPGWGCLKKKGGRQRKSPQQEVISYCNIVTFLYVPLVSIWIHTFFEYTFFFLNNLERNCHWLCPTCTLVTISRPLCWRIGNSYPGLHSWVGGVVIEFKQKAKDIVVGTLSISMWMLKALLLADIFLSSSNN